MIGTTNETLVREHGVAVYRASVVRCPCGKPIPKGFPSHFCYGCDCESHPDRRGLAVTITP